MDLLTPLFNSIGARLVVKDGAILPQRCAICNKQVTAPPKRFVLRWDPNGFVTQQFGLIGALISFLRARRGTLYVHFCPWHAKRRLVVRCAAAAGVVLFGSLMAWNDTLPSKHDAKLGIFLAGTILSTVLLVGSLFSNLYFRAVGINGDSMEIKGFGKAFRKSLNQNEVIVIEELTSNKKPVIEGRMKNGP